MTAAKLDAVHMCQEHQFVIEVRDREMSSRRSPGERVFGCAGCDRAVDQAFAAIGWEKP